MFGSLRLFIRRLRYPGSLAYWEGRYAGGGHSGAGSSGRLAAYKAEWLNHFVAAKGIHFVVEFGCGDGQQLQLARYPAYTGLDVAPSAIARCQRLFSGDETKQFALYQPFQFKPDAVQADLSLSLEVIFHLTEDALYSLYMQHLFAASRRWVVVFSSDENDQTGGRFPHFRPRRFTPDVPPGWILCERVENPHRDISVSSFFVFEKAQ